MTEGYSLYSVHCILTLHNCDMVKHECELYFLTHLEIQLFLRFDYHYSLECMESVFRFLHRRYPNMQDYQV